MDDFDPAPRLPMSSSERLAVGGLAVVILFFLVASFVQDWTPRKWGVLMIFVSWPILLVIHELGHAFAARMVGWHVSEIVIGYGREWKTFHWGRTKVRLKAVPIEGYVLPSAGNLRAPRLKSSWVYFGGPGAELLVLLLLWFLSGGRLLQATQEVWLIILQGVAISTCLGLFFTLIPLPLGGGATDGLGMILSVALPEDHFRQQLIQPITHRVCHHLILEETDAAQFLLADGLRQFPDDARLLALRAIAESQAGEELQSDATLEAALQHPPTVYSDIAKAWGLLRQNGLGVGGQGGGGSTMFALKSARDGLEKAPRDTLARCLFGWALLQDHQARDAYRHLMTAYKRASLSEEEGMCLALLALAAEEAGPGGADPHIPKDAVARFTGALGSRPLAPSFRQSLDQLGQPDQRIGSTHPGP